MENALCISDYPNDLVEMNKIIREIKNQGITAEIISPKHFHLDILFDHQFGYPKIKKFKQQVETSSIIYVMFQSWNKPLLWAIDALFNFLSNEELKGKRIIPIITESTICKNEGYQNFLTLFKSEINCEISSKWIFVQKNIH
jgi:hypothetical protein